MYSEEIGLLVPKTLTILDSIVNMVEGEGEPMCPSHTSMANIFEDL